MIPEERRRLLGAILAMLWLVVLVVADVANPNLELKPLEISALVAFINADRQVTAR